MAGPGKYVRTPETRAKSSRNAVPGKPCALDCTCGRHRSQSGVKRKKCPPHCDCLRHVRSPQHNMLIGMGVSLTAEAKRQSGTRRI